MEENEQQVVVGTDASTENLGTAHVGETHEATATSTADPAASPDDGPLTAANIAERARRARGEKAAEAAKPAEEPAAAPDPTAPPKPAEEPAAAGAQRGPDGKFLPKDGKAAAKKPDAATQTPPPGQAAAPAAAFKPAGKFSALGKEYDFPKHLVDAIKTPEQEQELKEVYEKAMGLDHVKMRHQELHTKFQETSKNFETLVGGVQDLRSIYADAVQSGNLLRLDDFFKAMEIPRDVILQYALMSAQYQEAEPAQRQVIDQALANQRRAFDLGKQNQGLSQTAATAESQALAVQMDTTLARADVTPIAQAYDSQPGRKPGSFREIVRKHGEYTFMTQNKFLTPDQAVQEVIAEYGLSAPGPQAPAAQSAPAAPAQAAAKPAAPASPPVVPAAHRSVPVIPNVTARSGASPTKTKPTSIEDIRKLSKNFNSAAR